MAAGAARAQDNFVRLETQPALGLDSVRIKKMCGAGFFVNSHSHALNLLTPSGMVPYADDDFARACQQPGIIQ